MQIAMEAHIVSLDGEPSVGRYRLRITEQVMAGVTIFLCEEQLTALAEMIKQIKEQHKGA